MVLLILPTKFLNMSANNDTKNDLAEDGVRIEVGIRITRGGGVVEEAWSRSEMSGVLRPHRLQDAFRMLHDIGLMHFNQIYRPAINELLREEIERLKAEQDKSE